MVKMNIEGGKGSQSSIDASPGLTAGTFAGANSSTGATNVDQGTRRIGPQQALSPQGGGFTLTGAYNVGLTGGGSTTGCLTKTGTRLFNHGFTGNVHVASGAKLGGTGTITANIMVYGRPAPGNSPGIQTFNGSVTHLATSTLEIDGAAAGNGSGFHDKIVLTGVGNVYTAAGTPDPRCAASPARRRTATSQPMARPSRS